MFLIVAFRAHRTRGGITACSRGSARGLDESFAMWGSIEKTDGYICFQTGAGLSR
jgi:hypothetical protein